MYVFYDCDSDLQHKYDFTKAQTAIATGGVYEFNIHSVSSMD